MKKKIFFSPTIVYQLSCCLVKANTWDLAQMNDDAGVCVCVCGNEQTLI